MSSKEDTEDYLPAIAYRFPNLKDDQDKFSRNCPLLAIPEIEREYTLNTHEEVTYLDYKYCVNETRLPVLRTLHSQRTLYRVAFYIEIRIICSDSNDRELEDQYLTDPPLNCFKFSATIKRGTFPIDHLVFNGLEVPASEYKKKEWIENDPRYFKEIPTVKEWREKINAPGITHKYTFEEKRPTKQEELQRYYRLGSLGHRPFIRTIETFSGQIRKSKVRKVIPYSRSVIRQFNIRQALSKRAPTWTVESAFDTTLNPYVHVDIYYFLTSVWLEWPERKY
jgi:hypothetical protein